ncbi:hypothetical protein NDU88_001745 [Pleurodeles waltl]|uniref:Uncharacterized protein n=1 Tax=Pleurodeles waltl TaxID=8319 RepID=A0AAV7R8V8_PLEWA|nr:hypothetical protein NDU88_001745 [Pleurodeles waltl]
MGESQLTWVHGGETESRERYCALPCGDREEGAETLGGSPCGLHRVRHLAPGAGREALLSGGAKIIRDPTKESPRCSRRPKERQDP